MSMSAEPIRIAHITDCYISGEPGFELCGVDTFATLKSILESIQNDPLWAPHLIIATGNLSTDGSVESYQRINDLFESSSVPIYCIPGNKDVLADMHTHLKGGPIHIERRMIWDPWQIFLLNSKVPREDYGYLKQSELILLEEELQQEITQNTLIGLHHGPIPQCNSPSCQLENSEEFLTIVRRYPQVRAVISGHTRCAMDEDYRGTQMLVTPSSFASTQHPDLPDPQEIDHTNHTTRRGYRRLDLYPDGQINTEIIWS